MPIALSAGFAALAITSPILIAWSIDDKIQDKKENKRCQKAINQHKQDYHCHHSPKHKEQKNQLKKHNFWNCKNKSKKELSSKQDLEIDNHMKASMN